tara:strand:- start:8457 stop:9602 length:1146 start_codon:yes stop_codon:yes gene_type:complete
MPDFNKKYKVSEPLNIVFTRSNETKKKRNIKYNMSGIVPKITIENENSSRPIVKIKNPISVKGIDIVKDKEDSDAESDVSGSTIEPSNNNKTSNTKSLKSISRSKSKFNADDYQNFINNSKKKVNSDKDSDSECSGSVETASVSGSESSMSGSSDYSDSSSVSNKKKDPKQEKQEILLKLVALEKRGIELTKKYSMSSKLSDLKFELELHKNNVETEMSVKFQQKILLAAVTGLEFANKKFDPIGAKLDGWSESIMDNLDDFESVFERLHEKYKTRAELPPELQLLVTLVGSAVMFHITKSMFSSALPSGNEGLQNSEIMKNIAAAMGNSGPPPKANNNEISGPSMNLSSMLRDTDSISNSTVETSKEVTINNKGKRAINI